MKKKHICSILLGSALMLVSSGVSQAEPSPDLMNSILRIRLEAQKNPGGSAVKRNEDYDRSRNWSETRNITAGQSVVAVPEVSSHIAAKGTKEFKAAPLK